MADAGCDLPQDRLIPYDEALQRLLDRARPVTGSETVSLLDGLGRVLAIDMQSTIDVPPTTNSAMDGYALRSADVNSSGASELRVAQRIAAGDTGRELEPGEAARIFTGAVLPAGADAVVMQEHTEVDGDMVRFDGAVSAGQNIRQAGEDIARGQVILKQGRRLRAQDLGLAASIGIDRIEVTRPVRVGIFFTGDELVEPGQPLPAGKIYDSNRYTLNGLLRGLGCDIVDLGIVGDTLAQTTAALERAAAETDLVITSGGVSVGEEDHVRIALEELGRLDMWRLRIKPGKPLAFGTVGDSSFLGLPGNPVSVFATFCLFVAPFIKRLQGRSGVTPISKQVTADFTWSRPDSRREFARARLQRNQDSRLTATLYPNQSSGVLMSTSWADGFVDIPENTTIQPGDAVEYLSFREILE